MHGESAHIVRGIPAADPAVDTRGPVSDPELDGDAVTTPSLSVSAAARERDYHVDDANARATPAAASSG